MEKNRKIPSLNKPEETSTVRIVSTSKSVVLRTMENSSSNDVLRNYATSSWMPDEYLNYTQSPFNSFDTSSSRFYLYNTTTNGSEEVSCSWGPAQHNLFQFSNMCFLSAFVIPRNYKSGILLFRIALTVSFVISAIWAGVHYCALDWFIWSSGLALTNSVHAVVLTFKFLPPALSLELTELYIRMFKPLKVSKKHFKELTKEACLLRLAPGETYAIEEVSPADEKLSVLLKGRLKVSCNGTFLHNISSYQFIDSPEWQANVTADGTRFQVTISAEEDSLCITWPRLQLDRILRHRPQLGFIFSNLIGKDITHKMYSLNEQIGQMCTTEALSRAAKEDHWRRSMNRSVSVDAVDTGTRGQVRSTAWKQAEKYRKSSTHSENASPLLGPQQCWLPLVASQFPADYPFMTQEDSINSQDDEREPMLPKNPQPRIEPTQLVQFQGQSIPQPIQILSQFPKLETGMPPVSLLNVATSSSFLAGNQSVALIPVIVPVFATAVSTAGTNSVTTVPTTTTASRAASLKRQRGVKFDETQL